MVNERKVVSLWVGVGVTGVGVGSAILILDFVGKLIFGDGVGNEDRGIGK